MLAWWMLVPTLLAMMVALVLPGFMWLRAGVRSSLIAIGAAPAFTFGLITVLTVLYPAFEISWKASTVMPVLGMSAVGGAVAWGLSYFHRVNGGFALNGVPFREAIGVRVPIGGHQAAIRAATWGTILVGFLLAAWPLLSVADPANPVQQWDPTFHQNGVHAILYGKDASPFGGLHELYGGRRVYYPTGWHAFVALFARYDSVVQASNVSSLALMAVWVIGLAALVSVLTGSRTALLATPIIGGMLHNMPADALTMYNQWPNSTGTVLVPGLAAVVIVAGRRAAADLRVGDGIRSLTRRIPQVLFLLIGCLGLVGAHPSAAFSLLAFLAAPLLSSIVFFARSALAREGRGQLTAILWVGVGLAVVALPLIALASPKIQAMGRYPRKAVAGARPSPTHSCPTRLSRRRRASTWWTLIQVILLIAGIVVDCPPPHVSCDAPTRSMTCADDGPIWTSTVDEIEAHPTDGSQGAAPMPAWPLVSYLILAVLTGPRLRARLRAAHLPAGPLVQGRATHHGRRRHRARRPHGRRRRRDRPRPSCGMDQFPCGGSSAERGVDDDVEAPRWPIQVGVGVARRRSCPASARLTPVTPPSPTCTTPTRLGKPGMAVKGELAMLRRMQYTTAPDALILGDPIAGAAYSEMLAGRKAVFPQLSTVNARRGLAEGPHPALPRHRRPTPRCARSCATSASHTSTRKKTAATTTSCARTATPASTASTRPGASSWSTRAAPRSCGRSPHAATSPPAEAVQAFADGIRSTQPGADEPEEHRSGDE